MGWTISDSFPGTGSRLFLTSALILFSTEVQNEWSYTSAPAVCLLGVDRDKFTFYLNLLRSSGLHKCPAAGRLGVKIWKVASNIFRIIVSFSPVFKNVFQFTRTEQKAPDNSEVHR